LAEAHASGLIHRDVKPHNIFLTRRGDIPDFVKVLDFGIVKSRNLEPQLELTADNALLGTPLYMSPEAVRSSSDVDALSDLYSLGTVGFELLTGETVFFGTSFGEVLLQQVRALPDRPSTRLKRPVSPDLENLIMQCLAKAPSGRPASAAALEEALGRCVAAGTWTRQAAEQWWSSRLKAPKEKTTVLTTNEHPGSQPPVGPGSN
jgi:eukaryotic-like serine/threonine-protein kinase